MFSKKHHHYFEIEAESHFDLGYQLGKLFDEFIGYLIEDSKSSKQWPKKVSLANDLKKHVASVFPQYLEEVQGLSEGCGLLFDDVWASMLEDELDQALENKFTEKCTSLVSNQGFLVGHNEDWDADAKDCVVLLKKTLNHKTSLELYYIGTLGGNSISVNSSGVVHAVNSLFHLGFQEGIPKNIVARWLSDSSNIRGSISQMAMINRSAGYHHTLVQDGLVISCESTSTLMDVVEPSLPFCHSNHYVGTLKKHDDYADWGGSKSRLQQCKRLVSPSMAMSQMKSIVDDQSRGPNKSLKNKRTIASMILDLKKKDAWVWLRRERSLGWVRYPLDFLES